jgi:fatty-acyl-CoA synthase
MLRSGLCREFRDSPGYAADAHSGVAVLDGSRQVTLRGRVPTARPREPAEGFVRPNYRTLIDAIDAGAGKADRGYTFLQTDGSELFYSFDRLRQEAIRRAQHLRSLGMKKGDRLAIVLPESQDFVTTFFGAVWAGIIPVPLYPPLSLGKLDAYLDTLVNILRKAEPTYLCTSARVQKLLWSIVGRVPSLQGVISAEDLAHEPPGGGSEAPTAVSLEDIAFLQFTSGSTSLPKGVTVTHGNLQANCWAIMCDGLQSDSATDVGVSWLPLYHDMGLIGFVLAPLFHDVPVAFIPTLSFIKNANIWMDTMHAKRGTISFAPNFAFALAAKRAKPERLATWDLSHVRIIGCGAEPIHPDTVSKFIDTFSACGLKPEVPLAAYGMAEATLAISFIGLNERVKFDAIDAGRYESQKMAVAAKADAPIARYVSVGRPFPKHEIAIFGDDGRRLPERSVGEIAVRGPSISVGYWRDQAATAETYRDGWLFTGDLGYVADGELYITGRRKDLIIVRGKNYDPQRIEWIVDEVEGVRKGSAVAFSRAGTESEELVVVAESRAADTAAVKQQVSQRINELLQLVPAEVVLVAPGAVPKTSSGKLQRAKTRSQYLAGTLGTEGVRTMGATAQRFNLAKHLTLSLVGRGRHMARSWLQRTRERFAGR